jgi:TetR/AcrR family transcriptional repressor of nem operon
VQVSRFKSKDQILDAVIAKRLTRTESMLELWEREATHPEDRIRHFICILSTNQELIQQYGCTVGTLCTDLAKLNHASQPGATQLFRLFRTWLRGQFTLLGRVADADALATHLLAQLALTRLSHRALSARTFSTSRPRRSMNG